MAKVTTYSNNHWALSEDVNADKLDVPMKGDPTDVESSIEDATDIVQGWWVVETGKDFPEDAPPLSTFQDGEENDSLAAATAYMAASLEHEKQTENVRSSRGSSEGASNEGKYVFLEQTARDMFDAWAAKNGFLGPTTGPGGEQGDNETAVGTPGVGVGKIGALIDLPERNEDC